MSQSKKIPTMSISLDESRAPYILGIDVGSTASRGGLYDATGCPVKGSKQRIAHMFSTDIDGTSVIDADQVVRECRDVVGGIVDFARDKGLTIQGVAMDSFASSFILIDGSGHALTPAITYADSRCAPYVDRLRAEVDEPAYQGRTGVRLHTSYHPARLAWAQAELPELWDQTETVMTIGEYVYFKLAGICGLATSTAAWSGIMRVADGKLDRDILAAVGVDESYFSPVVDPDQPAFPTDVEWDALRNIPWFHAIPDGWPSNVGPGAVDSSTVAVAAATSGAMRILLPNAPTFIPEGLWCYRLSKKQWIVGGALNDVGRAVSWLERTVAKVDDVEESLLAQPTKDTPNVLPFFSGERATGWAANARASIVGISDDTTPADLWRGVIEGIAMSYRRVWDHISRTQANPERVIASGRVTNDYPAWLAILADVLDRPVIPLAMKRATLRGTALIALDIIDHGGTRAEPPCGEAYTPDADNVRHYNDVLVTFEELYSHLV